LKHKISIKWKIFGYFLGFSLILLSLLWIFQVVLLNDFYKQIKTTQLKSYAQYLSNNIDNIHFDSSFSNSLVEKDICISVFSENGSLKYSSDIIRNCIIHKMPDRVLFSLAKELDEKNINFIEQNHENIPRYQNINLKDFSPGNILSVTKTTDKSGNIYYIVLNSAIVPVSATVSTLRTQLIYVTLIMLLLSFLLSINISKKISEPIIEINKKARNLATGDYSTKFNSNGYTEIAELAETLNYTATELSKVENLRQELISNISHDLRTPLTMITGYGEVMRDLPGENSPENIQIIIDEAKRLTSLVNNVLDISKLQSGVQEINSQPFNLTKLIDEILTRYNKLVEKDGYDISFEKDQEVFVNADEIRITQVLYNLINNAVTYTGEDKKIIIKQLVINNKVRIEIIDTGEGISEENLPYIWDRYYKVTGKHKRAQMGTGLGLSIVKGILKLHNAKYGVDSKPSQGSVFWFELELITK